MPLPISLRLETDRLLLRSYRSEDLDRVHIYGSDPEFSQYEIWGPNSLEDTKKFISEMVKEAAQEDRFKYEFAICLKKENLLIGGCGIRRESPDSCIANLGWAVNSDFQGKGIATEAARALLTFGFENLGLTVVYATCDVRNIASFKVMEKLGMKKVGLLKGEREVKGRIRDTLRYEILGTR